MDRASLPKETRDVAVRELERLRSMSPSLLNTALLAIILSGLGIAMGCIRWRSVGFASCLASARSTAFWVEKVKDRLLEHLAVLKLSGTGYEVRFFAW